MEGRVVEAAPPYPAFIIRGRMGERVGVIGDLHIGMETALLRTSPLSTFHSEGVIEKVKTFVGDYTLDSLVILGDLKHSILRPPSNERFLVTSLLTYLSGKGIGIHLIKGNHDSRIEEILSDFKNIHLSEKAWIKIPTSRSGLTLIAHGHRRIPSSTLSSSDLLILGHLHPCLKLAGEMGRTVILRIFLEMKAHHIEDGVKWISVIPAFNPLCCYTFNRYRLKRRLAVLRDFNYDPEKIKAFDLARNYLGELESPQEYMEA